MEERSIDVNATVCLHQGLLELVACARDSKEHESIVVLGARPIHIHTALLLLGAKPGTPAMQQVPDEESTRFIPVPPVGDPNPMSRTGSWTSDLAAVQPILVRPVTVAVDRWR